MTDVVSTAAAVDGFPDAARAVCGGSRCGQPIMWTLNEWGERVPVNADPDPVGIVILSVAEAGRAVWSRIETVFDDRETPTRYQLHRATCGDIERWRNLQRHRPGAEL